MVYGIGGRWRRGACPREAPLPPTSITPETVYTAVIVVAVLVLLGVILIKGRAKPAPPSKQG